MNIGAATSVGKVRSHNEDAFWFDDHCFLVCDGMGGHQAGEVAAALAVETVKNFKFEQTNPVQEITEAIQLAHDRVLDVARSDKGYSGMGTTLTMGMVVVDQGEKRLFVGHVGDSRAYVYNGIQLTQLTQDHSIVGELVRSGSLTTEEADSHPQRNVLTQALGAGTIQVDSFSVALSSDDRLVFCTDGLTGVVSDQQVANELAIDDPQRVAEKLVSLANEQGGTDNITVIIVFP